MSNISTAGIARILASGGFVCETLYPDAFESLTKESEIGAAREDVEIALGYLGMVLKASNEHRPEYFYAAPETLRLNSADDLPLIRKELNNIIANATGYLGFLELIDKATGMDSMPNAGFSFDLGEMHSALANTANTSLQDVFMVVRSTKYFKSSLSKKLKNDKERLDAMFDKLACDGLIADDGTGNNFAFTGKFSHYIRVVEYIRDSLVSHDGETETLEQSKLFV